MQQVKTIKHLANSGDVVSVMASLKALYELTGYKSVFFQQLNVPAQYYSGAKHPVVDESGQQVCMSSKMWEMVKPLLLSQEYIEGAEVFEGQKINVDIDKIRQEIFVNLPYMAIQQWPMLAFPDLAYDLTRPWIYVDKHKKDFSDKILLNFTSRYRNYTVNYFFLKEYEDKLIFAGTKQERDDFCKTWKLDIPLLEVKDFFELAQVIKSCKFLLSNQSMCWNIAEAMKTPRILEMSHIAPNCQPFIGKHSYGFFYQVGLTYYFKMLANPIPKDNSVKCGCCGHEAYFSFEKKGYKYYECSNCKTLLIPEGVPNDNLVGGGMEIERNTQQNDDRIERFIKLCFNDADILDFGCGHGLLVDDMRNAGLTADGYDKYNPEYSKMPQKKYDLVSMIEVIEHLHYPFNEINHIKDMLWSGGIVYIETSFVDLWTEPLPTIDYIEPSVGHCTIFSHKGLDKLMERKGFDIGNHINDNVRIYIKK